MSINVIFNGQSLSVAKLVKSYVEYVINPNRAESINVLDIDLASYPGITAKIKMPITKSR